MILNKKDLIRIVGTMTYQTDRLLDLYTIVKQLESDLFHEKWKFRYVARRLKQVAPHEAISEEELDEQIRQKSNWDR